MIINRKNLKATKQLSEESTLMISVAVSFKKLVVTLAPKSHHIDTNYQSILENFASKKRIQMAGIDTLENFEIVLRYFKPVELYSSEEIAKKIKGRL